MNWPDGTVTAVVCRDFAFFLAEHNRGNAMAVSYEGESCRKGKVKYAQLLLERIVQWGGGRISTLIVVGDGEGDVRLWQNCENLLKLTSPESHVYGFFLSHAVLDRFGAESDRLRLYSSWEELIVDLTSALSCSKNDGLVAALVDIDRTVLFPRISHDKIYKEVKVLAMRDYINAYRIEGHGLSAEIVRDLSDYCAECSSEYNNDLDEICFKNEEVVAVLTLLLASGLTIKSWLHGAAAQPLSELLNRGKRAVQNGGWISPFDLGSDPTCRSGEEFWDSSALLQHLLSIMDRHNRKAPCICEEFRLNERRHLIDCISAQESQVFNRPLLNALAQAKNTSVVFVSDRPTVSLDIEALGSLPSGVFWSYLLGHFSHARSS